MNKVVTLLSLFGGIDGFALGLSRAGFKIGKHYYSEIDKHASANCKYNFKNSIHVGSVTNVRGRELEHRPNIIAFGSPCQDFSLAGKRAGMEGQRSSLVSEAIRLISECRPDFFIWENVKGTFSSNNGADFWAIIQAFANIGGYRLEWQLLNTSWVLPQNRERIYLVGHSSETGRDFKGVFPFRESDFGTTEGATDSATVRALTAGGHSGGHHSGMTLVSENEISRTDRSGGRGSLTEKHNWDVIKAQSHGHKPMTITNTNMSGQSFENDYAGTLRGGASTNYQLVNNIRRLTEIECERLQGFPDNWTEFGDYDGVIKKIPKTQRYKMCGNAVTVDVVEMLAKRLLNNYYK